MLFQFEALPETGVVLDIPAIDPVFFTVVYLVGFYALLTLFVWGVRLCARKVHRTRLGLQKKVLLITVPKEAAEKKGESERKKTLQEVQEQIAVAQTFFSAIGGLRAERGPIAWFLGRSDEFSFEIVAQKGVISFYIAVPPRYRNFIEEQVHGLYSNAQVTEVEDYNIFKPKGVIRGGYVVARKHHLFPIKTYRKLEVDPLETLTNTLAKVAQTDGAAIQYVCRSAKAAWRRKGSQVAVEMQKGKSIHEAINATTMGAAVRAALGMGTTAEKKDQRTLSGGEQEAQKSIQEKSEQAGLDVNIRLVTCADTAERAESYLRDLMNAYNQYNLYESGNILDTRAPNFRRRLVRDFIYRTFRERWQGIYAAAEAASFFHFPLPSTETPNIRWLTARTAPPPPNLPQEGLVLGNAVYRGIDALVRIKKADRRRHVYVIGKSGVGKSWLMANMARQDIKNGEGVAVIDPHGDLIEDILETIPKERIDDVIYFDPSDVDRPVGLNMLEVQREEQKDFAVQEMIAIFYKLFPPEMIGPMFEHNMRNVMLTLMADPESAGTIAEIPRMFSDAEFQKQWVSKVKDPVVRAFWEKEMAKTSDFHKSEMLGYLISKVGRFVENEMMRNIIGQVHSGFDLREVMDKKKILLVNLAKGKTGEVNSNLLGLIIVSRLQMAAMTRAELPEAERHDFYLYIDEFQNFITDSIATILSEARKYRLNLTIAHQYMGQLVQNNDAKIRDAVLGNAGTMVSFRIGVEDADVLAKEFAPVFNAYDLVNVEKFTAYVKLLVDNTAVRPFSMNCLPLEKGDAQRAEIIKQLSRLKYGRDRAVVESEILERSQLGAPARSAGPMVGEKSL